MEITNVGTQIKIALALECAGLAMSDYDFTATFFTFTNKWVVVPKSKMVYDKDSATYIAVVDTAWLSEGEVKVRVEADIPDSDAASGYRKEIATVRTGIMLNKCGYGMS